MAETQESLKLPIIIDLGSSEIKAGLSGEEKPSVKFKSYLGEPKFKKVFSPLYKNPEMKVQYIGEDCFKNIGLNKIRNLINHGKIANEHDIMPLFNHIYSKLGISTEEISEHPVLITEPLLNPYINREKIADSLFDDMGVPALFFASQPILSLFSTSNTSGIILAGKNPMASKLLNIAIRERYLTKKYLCLVKGELTLKGSFEAFLVKDNDTNKVCVSESGAENDRIITGIKPLAYNGRSTLTEIDLITGKPHQIRAHLAFLGHPLAGDTKYGDIEYNDYFRRKYKLKWQLLHAYRIEFDEMTDNLSYLNGKHIEAPLHEQFEKILKGENLWQHGIPED